MPKEVHEHRDAEGNLTGTTTVVRESPWDDIARGQAYGLFDWDEGICSCGCGLPRAEAHEAQIFMVETETCYAAKAVETFKRKKREDAERRDLPEGWDDGVHHFARVMTEDEAQKVNRPRQRVRRARD